MDRNGKDSIVFEPKVMLKVNNNCAQQIYRIQVISTEKKKITSHYTVPNM